MNGLLVNTGIGFLEKEIMPKLWQNAKIMVGHFPFLFQENLGQIDIFWGIFDYACVNFTKRE